MQLNEEEKGVEKSKSGLNIYFMQNCFHVEVFFKSDNTHHDGEDVETLPLSILVLILIIQTKYYTCDKHIPNTLKNNIVQKYY